MSELPLLLVGKIKLSKLESKLILSCPFAHPARNVESSVFTAHFIIDFNTLLNEP